MYADPAHIRKHVVKVRLNDDEMKALEQLAQRERSQNATLAYEILVDAIADMIEQRKQLKQLA